MVRWDSLEGGAQDGVEARFKVGRYIYIYKYTYLCLIHVVVWQKQTQCCEAIVLQ